MNEIVEEIAHRIGGAVRYDYSGRGMFGARCIGIVCDDLAACIEEAAAHGLRGARTDNMGQRIIVYWPSMKASGSSNPI